METFIDQFRSLFSRTFDPGAQCVRFCVVVDNLKKKVESHLATDTDTSGLVVLNKESSVGCMCSEVVSYVIFLRLLLDTIVTV